ncbi:MAG: methyl viologen-reducing hydrogenase [Candidatus Bipolaricaulota bacterium]|nr:MAG: methyl viologen-reducing hydrogenase [Candidatus Bipolaricaulota bacterium]
MAVRVAEEWLTICGGCEVSILDIGEPLIDVLALLEFVHMPVLMDHKYYGQTGEGTVLEIPEADVGMISGGVRNEKEKHVTEAMRAQCETLIALGSCACFGGIPAMANMYSLDDLYSKVYRESPTTEPAEVPSGTVPSLLDRVYAIDEVVPVDLYIPGCPMNPGMIAEALTSLIDETPFELAERSVCDECPVKRERKSGEPIERPLQDAQFDLDGPLENMRCLMEQGILCLGPVTRAGCARTREAGAPKVPRCIQGYMPCRGCFGPIRMDANPLVDMMGALSSNGLDVRQVLDRRATFNRYIGARNRLRPLPSRPAR